MALCAAGLGLAGCDRASRDTPPLGATGRPSADAAHAPDAAFTAMRVEAGAPSPGVAPGEDILRGLSTDARVLDCPGGVVEGRSAFDASWVVVHPLDLDADGRDDWLVEGRHRCLSGPDGADWWVYAGGAAGARLLVAAGRARAVEVLPAMQGGFHDLRLQADGGDVRLRYAAGAYAPVGPGGPAAD